MAKLSIIIPAYNEEATVTALLEKVVAVHLVGNIEKEIVVINDASRDNTLSRVEAFISDHPDQNFKILNQTKNQGKGAALQRGFAESSGDYLIIQDADLEYDPEELNTLLGPIIDGVADVVYGSRFMGSGPHRVLFYRHYIGNKFLTFLSNLFTNINLTDMETCYKMMTRDIVGQIKLKEKRFGIEPEMTAKIAKIPGVRIYEVGISYFGRTYEEGKKIGWKDGVRAIYCILRYNIFG